MKYFITGGAGFIGTHLVQRLIAEGHSVFVLDSFSDQVHDASAYDRFKSLVGSNGEVYKDDIRNVAQYKNTLNSCDHLIHLASETGTAQSMYETDRYISTNINGTTDLFTAIDKNNSKLRSVVLSSSRSVYGEGSYLCNEHGVVYPSIRSIAQLTANHWDLTCPVCESVVFPCATKEIADIDCGSFYAYTKYSQELLANIFLAGSKINLTVLRFQNVYGPGQSLKNPYTGVLSIFVNRIKNGHDLPLYEDGGMIRDFVFVSDVVHSIKLATEYQRMCPRQPYVFNIGSGVGVSIRDAVKSLLSLSDGAVDLYISGQFRVGDIRSCFADLENAKMFLGYVPAISFDDGLKEFYRWAISQPIYEDLLDKANNELYEKGLMK